MFDLAAFAEALSTVFSVYYLFFIFLGVLIGIVAGILPGINGAIGISLILPFTFGLPPAAALLMMLGLWGGQNFGGGVTSILVHTPGAASGAATIFDGYPLSQRGETGKALGIICIASSAGWLVSAILLSVIAIPLASVALRFGPPEYFAIGVFGLSMVASISAKNVLKGVISTVLGLLIVVIGTDPFSGLPRFTFARYELIDGISFLIVMIGVFALAEALVQVQTAARDEGGQRRFSPELPSWAEIRRLIPTIARSSVLGTLIGTVPGAGGSIAAFIAYSEAKRFSKNKEEFGHGSHEGLAAPEAANNATEGGAMVPLLTLGVPGSGAAAVILAAMIVFGITPSPQIFEEEPVLIYSLFIGMAVAALTLLVLGLSLTRWLAHVMKIPKAFLVTGVTGIAFMAALTITGLMFDVYLLIFFGAMGYLLRRYEFPEAPLILAMVLGFMIETSLRRSMILSDGDWSIFFTRPISATILLISFASMGYPIWKAVASRARRA